MSAKMLAPHSFRIGKSYRTLEPEQPEAYLDTALQAEKYIAARQVLTEEGIYWKTGNAGKETWIDRFSLYSGSSGILYFYMKLYLVTESASFYEIVRQAVQYICIHLEEAFPKEIRNLKSCAENVSLDVGILGISGIGFVLEEVYQIFRWEFAEEALHKIARFYEKNVVRREGKVCWTESTTMITDSGILLFLLKYNSIFHEPYVDELIRSAGRWFLDQAIEMEDGSARYAGLECVWEGIKPNFEVGTAGSGFVLCRLFEWTKEKEYLDMAEKCARFLMNCQIPQSRGALIPFRWDTPDVSLNYLGTCSGPAGTSRFFYLLYRLSGDPMYWKEIETLVDGMEAAGAPEKQSAGLWNNVTMCCGHAGILQFFIGLYEADHEQRWYCLAQRTAEVILGEKDVEEDGAVRWTVAPERIYPERLCVPLGYYTGTAGIAASLLQIYMMEKDQFCWERFADDPFPTKPLEKGRENGHIRIKT